MRFRSVRGFPAHLRRPRLGLKAVQIPIRYIGSTYGETQISRFRQGFMLLRMVMFAFLRIKAL
jgi:hypothetical protein